MDITNIQPHIVQALTIGLAIGELVIAIVVFIRIKEWIVDLIGLLKSN